MSLCTLILVCLADKDTTKVPSNKAKLDSSGLGERRLTLSSRDNAHDLHSRLLSTFTKLDGCGGYELLRAQPNCKTLYPIPVPQTGYTPVALKEIVGNSRIYIRPMQKSIPLEATTS